MIWAGLLALGLSAAPAKPPASAPAPAPSAPISSLARAEKLLDDLDYEGAALALLQASKTPRNDRRTILRILELQGVIAASLDQKASALNFFRQLLALDPEYKLNEATYSAEQRAPFNQARAGMASTGSLRFEVAPARAKAGMVETVVVKVAADPLTQARKVRLWLRIGDAPWKESVVPLVEGRALAPAGAEAVSFWAELLGEYEGQLATIGSREKPIVLRAPAAGSAMLPGAGVDLGGYRPLALASVGCGVVAAAVGVFFGLKAAEINPRLERWRSSQPVTEVTMVQAQRLVDEANANAVVADSLFAAAGVLGAGGAVLWFIEPEKAPGPGEGGVRLDVRWRF